MEITHRDEITPFTTKDGSEIRELLAHRNSCMANQSLAEATVPLGATTDMHYHPKAEEIYYVLEGTGLMRLGEEESFVRPGDAIAIPPGTPHNIRNDSEIPLRFLCCCAPAYEHEDTVLVDD